MMNDGEYRKFMDDGLRRVRNCRWIMVMSGFMAGFFWYFGLTNRHGVALFFAAIYTVFVVAFFLLGQLQAKLLAQLSDLRDKIIELRGRLKGKDET